MIWPPKYSDCDGHTRSLAGVPNQHVDFIKQESNQASLFVTRVHDYLSMSRT